MPVLQHRMHEVILRIVGETQAFHQSTGAEIGGSGEGDEFIEVQYGEGVVHGLLGGGEGDAAAPVFSTETPADLHAGCEGGGELGFGQTGEPGELAIDLDSPEAPAFLVDALTKPAQSLAGFLGGQGAGEIPHDLGVRVHGREGFEIRVGPLPQDEGGVHGR